MKITVDNTWINRLILASIIGFFFFGLLEYVKYEGKSAKEWALIAKSCQVND